MTSASRERRLTGRAVLAMFVTGFGIIIAVNLVLAVSAVRTFPGLEVANSYVASQDFDLRRAAQDRLGWQVAAEYVPGRLSLALTNRDGTPIRPADIALHLGRPTEQADDLTATLDEALGADLVLAPGRWRLDVSATAPDGTAFRKILLISVPQ